MRTKINKEYLLFIFCFLLFQNVTYSKTEVYLSTSSEEIDYKKYKYEGTVYQMDAVSDLISEEELKKLEKLYSLKLEQVYDLNHSNPSLPVKIITIQKYDRRLKNKNKKDIILAQKVAVKKDVFPLDKNIKIKVGTRGYIDIPEPYRIAQETLGIKGFSSTQSSFSYRIQLKASEKPFSLDNLVDIKQKCGRDIIVKEEFKEADHYPYKCQINHLFTSWREAKEEIVKLNKLGFKGAFPVKYSLQEIKQ